MTGFRQMPRRRAVSPVAWNTAWHAMYNERSELKLVAVWLTLRVGEHHLRVGRPVGGPHEGGFPRESLPPLLDHGRSPILPRPSSRSLTHSLPLALRTPPYPPPQHLFG